MLILHRLFSRKAISILVCNVESRELAIRWFIYHTETFHQDQHLVSFTYLADLFTLDSFGFQGNRSNCSKYSVKKRNIHGTVSFDFVFGLGYGLCIVTFCHQTFDSIIRTSFSAHIKCLSSLLVLIWIQAGHLVFYSLFSTTKAL